MTFEKGSFISILSLIYSHRLTSARIKVQRPKTSQAVYVHW